jgi:hypothetical protein
MAELNKGGAVRKYKSEGWSAKRVLEAYGLRITGKSLTVPCREPEGGRKVLDEEEQAVRCVQSIEGYTYAEPILKWVHSEGHSPSDFRPNKGEELACRLLWGVGASFDLKRSAAEHYRAFYRALEISLRERPFIPILFDEDEDAA